jgi:hypothetical protein
LCGHGWTALRLEEPPEAERKILGVLSESPGVEAYAGCPGEGDPWPSVGCRAHGHLQRTTALTKAEGESSVLLGHICWMRATPLWEAVFRGEGDPR